jgi:hypothetical protein
MSKILCLSISMVLLFALLLSGTAFAQDTSVSILFGYLNVNVAGDKTLADILLIPAGYTNIKMVSTMADFTTEWAKRADYDVLIFSYHTFTGALAADTTAWLNAELANIEAWVKSGGIIMTTMGRDVPEIPLAEVFGLKLSDPNTVEAIVPVKAPFDKDIAGSILDSSTSADQTPQQGQIYGDPLPSWATVVTTNLAGLPSSVAGRYGSGAIWAGAGFEVVNVGAGTDPDQSTFIGFKQLWKNMLDWATTSPSAVAPDGKVSLTWGAIKNR